MVNNDQAAQILEGLKLLAKHINALVNTDTANKQEYTDGLNNLQSAINSIDFSVVIDDTIVSSPDLTWSVDKIRQMMQKMKDDLIAGAPGALDTFNEIALKMASGDDVVTSIISSQAKRVAVDQEQAFNNAEKAQARTNISAVHQADFDSLLTKLGDLDTDFASGVQAVLTSGALPTPVAPAP